MLIWFRNAYKRLYGHSKDAHQYHGLGTLASPEDRLSPNTHQLHNSHNCHSPRTTKTTSWNIWCSFQFWTEIHRNKSIWIYFKMYSILLVREYLRRNYHLSIWHNSYSSQQSRSIHFCSTLAPFSVELLVSTEMSMHLFELQHRSIFLLECASYFIHEGYIGNL